MKTKQYLLILVLIFSTSIKILSQSVIPVNKLSFPDLDDYITLKCDFHIHTVFSDGYVWPDYRVEEAIYDGLDVIAITDHIEYIPHKEYLNFDHNTSYEIAKEAGLKHGLLVIKGAEITRSMPPGHLNALFIKDANLLNTEKVEDALKAAHEQEAFILWNHPCWDAQQPDTIKWFDMHTDLYNKGYIHGIELVNYSQFCPEAWKWAKEKNLTLFSSSDIHSTTQLTAFKKHRPITIVFAKEYSENGIKEALLNKRTIAYYDENLYGNKELLEKLFKKSIIINKKSIPDYQRTIYEITNISSANIILETVDKSLPLKRVIAKSIEIPPHSSISFVVNYKKYESDKIEFIVKTFFYDLDKNIKFELDAK